MRAPILGLLFLALPALAAPAFAEEAKRVVLTPEKMRPPAEILVPCEGENAPPVLPEDLAKWVAIYCTKFGHVLSPNDRYAASYPGGGARGALLAAQADGATEPGPSDSRFVEAGYVELTPEQAASVKGGASGYMGELLSGNLHRIDLRTAKGATLSAAVTDMARMPFWVFPLKDGKPGGAPFHVVSLDWVNARAAERSGDAPETKPAPAFEPRP